MVTLVLVRHAKSDWGDAHLNDHDRPLNARGLRDAPAMAERLALGGMRLDAILASTALRARTTASFFGACFGLRPELDAGLYGAPARTLLTSAVARRADATMVVAHDPGMTVLAERLSGGGIGAMPTCATATFRWDTDDWDVAEATDPDSWRFAAPGS